MGGEKASKIIQQLFDMGGALHLKIIQTLLIVLIVFIVRAIMKRLITGQVDHVRRRYYWTQGVSYFLYLTGFILVARIWFVGLTSVVTFFGLVGAGLMIAMNDSIANLVGFGFVIWRRPFIVGDRIKIDGYLGDVIDIAPFQFIMMEAGGLVGGSEQSTGRMLHVPNNLIMKKPLVNYTKGFRFIWHETKVTVTFESDWQKAKKILENIVHSHALELSPEFERQKDKTAENYMILFGKLTPIVYVNVCDIGVDLVLRYLVTPKQVRSTEGNIWMDILNEFKNHEDIDFAYPTVRYYNNTVEGKPQARVPLPSG